MNITLARELLQSRGYQLDMRNEQWGKLTVCRIYAVNGKHEHRLCSMTEFTYLGVTKFQQKIANLPTENGGKL